MRMLLWRIRTKLQALLYWLQHRKPHACAIPEVAGNHTSSGVNVFFNLPIFTGKSIKVPQYNMGIVFQWTTPTGEHETSRDDILFPDILAKLPQDLLIEAIAGILVDSQRKVIGVDK